MIKCNLIHDTKGQYGALFLAVLMCWLIPSSAFAMASPMGTILCAVIEVVYGTFGRALATIAVISLGIGAMLGKVSWGLAVTVIVGIGVTFGSAGITKIALIAAGGAPTIGCAITG